MLNQNVADSLGFDTQAIHDDGEFIWSLYDCCDRDIASSFQLLQTPGNIFTNKSAICSGFGILDYTSATSGREDYLSGGGALNGK